MSTNMRIITEKTVAKYLTFDDAIGLVEQTWKWYSEGKIVMPAKITTDMEPLGVKGWFNAMPSYVAPLDAAGLKLVGGYSDNPKNGLPYIRANVLLTDPSTGTLKALIAGDLISTMRTGAQPAVACKYLAAKTDVVTFIGAGAQAVFCLTCMSRILDIKEVRVCDLFDSAKQRFIDHFGDHSFRMKACGSNREGCEGADVIITITSGNGIFVEEPWLKKGSLVLTMGSFTETSDEVVTKADKLYADHIGQGLHRGNFKTMVEKGLIDTSSFAAQLTDVVAGKAPGRENDSERIIAELVGMGCPDLVLGATVYNRVIEAGVEVPSFCLTE